MLEYAEDECQQTVWMLSICRDNVYLMGHECGSRNPTLYHRLQVRDRVDVIPLFVVLRAFQTDSFPFFSHDI
jgi:hypothetical protein